MAEIEIRIPQLGEGLQEARLVRFLKHAGDSIQQDEPIYEMETDKAVMEIESPTAGVLARWSAKEDDVLPIGTVIGTISADGTASAAKPDEDAPPAAPSEDGSAPRGSLVDIRIPQLGEGLQEARIVRFLKEPGESVARDEPIYEMETDKAVMEIESPAAGVIESWAAKIDDVVPIGEKIGSIRTETPLDLGGDGTLLVSDAPISEKTDRPAPQERSTQVLEEVMPLQEIRNRDVSPRTRAYAFQKGLTEGQLLALARTAGRKLLPEDIDRHIHSGPPVESASRSRKPAQDVAFHDSPLPGRQKTFNFRLQRSGQLVVPATMEMAIEWANIDRARAQLKAQKAEHAPSQFLLFAWCVTEAAKEHPRLLSALVDDSTLRQYEHLHLGVAVARPGDELLMARIVNATALSFDEFITAAQDAIRRARDGEDQTSEAMQLSLTSMSGVGVTLGIPVVVAPAVGTLFIGAPYDEPYPLPGGGVAFRRVAKMVLTFDHRIMNGVGAARFLSDIRTRAESFSL